MARPSVRIVRRSQGALVASAPPARRQAITAASMPVTDPQQIFNTALRGGRRNDWQGECWDMLDLVGELGYVVRFRASGCSRVRLIASEIDPDTGLPTGSIAEDNPEGDVVAQVVHAVAGGPLGQAALIERMAKILTVAGELWVAILQRPEGERWFAVTREEIAPGTLRDSVVITLPDGKKHDFMKGRDGMFRVWNPHARKAAEPDSPVRAVLPSLREIVRTTAKIRNADQSRMYNAGILVVASEASLPPSQAPVSADKPDVEPTAEVAQPVPVATGLQNMIVDVTMVAHKDPDSMAGITPVVISAPAEHVDKIKLVELGKDVTDLAIKTRTDAITRFAMGFDMSPEQLLGLGSNSNHWSSRQVEDQDVQVHVAPLMQTIVAALYDNVVRNVLVKLGIDPNKYVVWYDTSRLTADPDLSDEADQANDRGALRSDRYRHYKGLAEDDGYDLTSIDGYKELARDVVAKSPDPDTVRFWLPLLDPVSGIEFPEPVPALPPGQEPDPAVEDETDPETGDEPNTEDKQAAAISDVGISMAVELMVNRALELAGKRRVRTNDMAQRSRLRDVDAHDYHRFMSPVSDAEVVGLVKGWDVGLDEIAARYGLDANQVRAVVFAEAKKRLTAQVVDA